MINTLSNKSGPVTLYYVTNDYCSLLKSTDSRVLDNHHGGKLRPHVGVLMAVQSRIYLLPFKSPKPKYRQTMTLVPFPEPAHKQRPLGALGYIDLANMIPVADHDEFITKIPMGSFQSSDAMYFNLLQDQITALHDATFQSILKKNSRIIYRKSAEGNPINSCCLNYDQLETRLDEELTRLNLSVQLGYCVLPDSTKDSK